jgi:hypothetical protein
MDAAFVAPDRQICEWQSRRAVSVHISFTQGQGGVMRPTPREQVLRLLAVAPAGLRAPELAHLVRPRIGQRMRPRARLLRPRGQIRDAEVCAERLEGTSRSDPRGEVHCMEHGGTRALAQQARCRPREGPRLRAKRGRTQAAATRGTPAPTSGRPVPRRGPPTARGADHNALRLTLRSARKCCPSPRNGASSM